MKERNIFIIGALMVGISSIFVRGIEGWLMLIVMWLMLIYSELKVK